MTRQNAEHGGEVGCGSCGKGLSPDRRAYTGSAAYCEDCASDVYGDHFRVAPSAPTHADEGGGL